MPAFTDHYGAIASEYASFRPRYPASLFAMVAREAPSRGRCWDCATGSGQAAVGLADHFDEVFATDASAEQIAHAVPRPGVTYRCEPAEATSLPDRSVDAVTVAAALHWLDRPAFFAEVRRVCRPGAVLAAWTYTTRIDIGPAVDAILVRYVEDVLGPFWPPEFSAAWNGYRDVAFPFAERTTPQAAIEERWDLGRLLAYLETWSAARRYREAHGLPATHTIRDELAAAWGDPERARAVRLPVTIRMGTVST